MTKGKRFFYSCDISSELETSAVYYSQSFFLNFPTGALSNVCNKKPTLNG